MENKVFKQRAVLYVAILYALLLGVWIPAVILPEPHKQNASTLLWALFSILPVIATFLVRKMTRDHSPWYLKPNFRENWRTYLAAAFLPGTAIFLSAWLFFLIFPQDLDLGAGKLIEMYARYGAPDSLQLTPMTVFLVGFAFIFISPLVVPVHVFALGEEIGWRGYLLPILMKIMGQRKAVLLHGLLWGLAHAPLISLGFNYGSDYWGAPFSGILMMVLVCIVLGTWLAWTTIPSKSILPACIFHGAANVIGEMPVLVSLLSISPLIGPNPTGIVGMVGLLIGAVILLLKMPEKRWPVS